MRGAAIAAVAAVLLAGCESKEVRAAHDAEKRAAMVYRSTGSKDDRCAAKREVAAAWLAAMDEEKYRMARIDADLACNDAALEHLRD